MGEEEQRTAGGELYVSIRRLNMAAPGFERRGDSVRGKYAE